MQIPFALSLSKYLNSAGADVGFASLLAVALLVVLHFAHARETKTLRERLGEAHDRIDALEARLAQMMHLQATRPQQPPPSTAQRPAVVAPGGAVPARPMGSAVASLRRQPAAGAQASNGQVPVAPVGVAAPALLSATSSLPPAATPAPTKVVTAPTGVSTAEDTMLVAAAEGAENGDGAAATRAVPAMPPAPAVAAPSTAVGRGGPRAGTGAGAGAPPRVQIRPETPSGTVRRPPQPPRGSLLDDPPSGPGRGRRVLAVLGALVAIVVIVVVLTKLTSNSATPNPKSAQASTSTTASKTTKTKFSPRDVTVAVLNGTSVSGLAKDVSQNLAKKGYAAGSIANAAVQTEKSTIVYYMPNQRAAAKHVAAALKLKPAAVQAATQSAIQSCAATPGTGTGTNSCQGEVIVSVGQDRASLASASQSS